MTTGEKIAALRREKGLSQEALGEQLGLSRQAVSKWEADQAVPTMDNLMELSRLFGVPVDTLLRPEEALPGKGTEMPEGVKISAEGLKISYAPVLTKKTRWFIITIAVLLLVSVLGNLYAMMRVQGMQGELDAMRVLVDDLQANAHTVIQPNEQQADGSSEELTDAQMQYMLDPDNPEELIVTLSALPSEISAEDTAKFTIRSGTESWSCATWLDGVYSGQINIPMCDYFSAYLVLTSTDGAQRNLLIGSEYGVRDKFTIAVDAVCVDPIQSSYWGGTSVEGIAGITVYSHGGSFVEENGVYPVELRIVLLKNGQEFKAMELDVQSELEAEVNGNEDGFLQFTAELHWTQLDAEEDELTLQVELTDNYGRVTTYPFLM